MNPQLNKKVKKYLDSYFKDTKANSPEHQEAVMLILKGALTDANFHSEAKELGKYFPKASKKYIGTPMEDVIESKGTEISKMAKYDGHDIIDAFAFYLSMSIGGSFGNRLMSLKESIEESLVKEGEQLDEKNVPTNPSKWSYYKAQAKKKFDVYPSAYANGWAAKQYKKAGGGWKSESVNEGYGEFIKAKNLTDIVNLSKKKKNAVFYVTDDNNSRIGAFYLKNGKFAKATTANASYDLQNSKTKLRDRSDVIYKYKVDESVNEAKDKVFVVMFKDKKDLPNKNIKPSSAVYAKEADAKKFLKSVEKDGGKGMIVKSNKPVGVKVNEGKFDRDVEKLYDAKEFDKFIKRYKSKFDKKDYKQLLDYAKSLNNEERDFEREDFDDPFDEQNAEMQLDTSREDLRELILKSLNESVNEGRVEKEVLQKISKFETLLGYITNDDQYKPLVSKVKKEIDKLKKQIKKNESVNEVASRTAMEIGGLTGMNKDAIQKFVDDNNLDIEKVYQFVKKGKLADRMKLVSAIAGKPNNPVQKKMVKQFGESINELLAIVDKFDEKRQSYGKVYYKDMGRPGDINKAKSELAKLRLNPKRKDLTLISVGRNSKMYDVMGESVNESQLKEFKHKVGSETIQFKVSPYRTGISLIAASGNDLDKLQDVMSSEDEVKGEIRKSLEKKLRIPIEIDRDYEGAGFGFKIDLYSLAKMVK
jgi:hypothetical protein